MLRQMGMVMKSHKSPPLGLLLEMAKDKTWGLDIPSFQKEPLRKLSTHATSSLIRKLCACVRRVTQDHSFKKMKRLGLSIADCSQSLVCISRTLLIFYSLCWSPGQPLQIPLRLAPRFCLPTRFCILFPLSNSRK